MDPLGKVIPDINQPNVKNVLVEQWQGELPPKDEYATFEDLTPF